MGPSVGAAVGEVSMYGGRRAGKKKIVERESTCTYYTYLPTYYTYSIYTEAAQTAQTASAHAVAKPQPFTAIMTQYVWLLPLVIAQCSQEDT